MVAINQIFPHNHYPSGGIGSAKPEASTNITFFAKIYYNIYTDIHIFPQDMLVYPDSGYADNKHPRHKQRGILRNRIALGDAHLRGSASGPPLQPWR